MLYVPAPYRMHTITSFLFNWSTFQLLFVLSNQYGENTDYVYYCFSALDFFVDLIESFQCNLSLL